MKMFNEMLGKLLREKRKNASISQDEVAEELGVTQGRVSHAEKGVHPYSHVDFLKVRRMIGMAEHDDCEVNELFRDCCDEEEMEEFRRIHQHIKKVV